MSRPARYSRWDGTQNPLGPELPIDELADQLAEDVLDGWGIDNALRRMLNEGMQGRFAGLAQMRERLRRLREEQARRTGRPDPLGEFRERLSRIEATERAQLAGDPSDEARFAELELDALADNMAARIRQLREYEWTSSEAREQFESLLDDIRRQVLDASFRQLSEGVQSLDPDELARLKDMLADLNALMDARAAGLGPSQEEFDQFMGRHGGFFPENPRTFDELLEVLARRAMAMSRYMASLTPEQRAELQSLMEDLMGDMDLAFEMDRFGANLRTLAPQMPWDQPMDGSGEPMGLGEGLDAIDRASRLEELDQALAQDYPGASLEDIDTEQIKESLGEDAARDLQRLRAIEKMLEEAGVITRTEGKLELTARGVRKLGERALTRVFERLKIAQAGSHEVVDAGGLDEPTGSTRPWRFGDPFRLDLGRTVHNAVVRSGPGKQIRLHPDDFEIAEAEHRTRTATVLLLDMSRSMPLRGHWLPAKRMALALHTLISTTYPEDHLEIIGFSDYARPMSPRDLAEVDWEPVYGTNMEHAFNLAGRALAKHRDASKQVLLVTDGEPTAHLEGEYVFFNWPPVRETLEKTYREAMRLARSGVTMNIFMLEQSPGLTGFIERLARLVHGRV
ncbi:MAG: vWA domain-containing protein, partial [Acidimicrobiia bacterium]